MWTDELTSGKECCILLFTISYFHRWFFLLVSPRHISKHISDVVLTRVDDVTFNMAQLILELMAVRSGVFKFSGVAFSLADI